MTRRELGRCAFNNGRHKWIDMTTKDDAPRKHFTCAYCRKEAIE